jgi:hypothetical protein
VRRVWRSEWLRVFPKDVFLPVLMQTRGIWLGESKGSVRLGQEKITGVLDVFWVYSVHEKQMSVKTYVT